MDLEKIDRILVFTSDKPINEIVLPNGEDPHEADMAFLVHSFWKGEIPGIRECTSEYIQPSIEKKQ